MSNKRYDHRLFACVDKRKCLPGIELPVTNPGSKAAQGKKNGCMEAMQSLTKKKKKISDDRIIELFEKKINKTGSSGSITESSSVDKALSMLLDKTKLREKNKVGAELQDIKDRMMDVRAFILEYQ